MGYSFWKASWLDQLKCSYPVTQWPHFWEAVLRIKCPSMREKKCMFPALFIIMKIRNKLHVSHY